MDDEETLQGGVNQIRRIGSTVVRPSGAHSPSVHRLLHHLRAHGFDQAPEPIALDASSGTETLAFIEGTTTGYPITAEFRTDQALSSAGHLLRRYHGATGEFTVTAEDQWSLSPLTPHEVTCHGDFAPYNCVVVNGQVTGVFDFDTAHPGPRLADVGYAAFRWAPLTARSEPEGFGDVQEQARRLALFCRSYGDVSTEDVVRAAIERLTDHVSFIREQAASGHEAFARHVEEGHDQLYLADIGYMTKNIAELAG